MLENLPPDADTLKLRDQTDDNFRFFGIISALPESQGEGDKFRQCTLPRTAFLWRNIGAGGGSVADARSVATSVEVGWYMPMFMPISSLMRLRRDGAKDRQPAKLP